MPRWSIFPHRKDAEWRQQSVFSMLSGLFVMQEAAKRAAARRVCRRGIPSRRNIQIWCASRCGPRHGGVLSTTREHRRSSATRVLVARETRWHAHAVLWYKRSTCAESLALLCWYGRVKAAPNHRCDRNHFHCQSYCRLIRKRRKAFSRYLVPVGVEFWCSNRNRDCSF